MNALKQLENALNIKHIFTNGMNGGGGKIKMKTAGLVVGVVTTKSSTRKTGETKKEQEDQPNDDHITSVRNFIFYL